MFKMTSVFGGATRIVLCRNPTTILAHKSRCTRKDIKVLVYRINKGLWRNTVFPRRSHTFYIVTYYMKWVTTSWTFFHNFFFF